MNDMCTLIINTVVFLLFKKGERIYSDSRSKFYNDISSLHQYIALFIMHLVREYNAVALLFRLI